MAGGGDPLLPPEGEGEGSDLFWAAGPNKGPEESPKWGKAKTSCGEVLLKDKDKPTPKPTPTSNPVLTLSA